MSTDFSLRGSSGLQGLQQQQGVEELASSHEDVQIQVLEKREVSSSSSPLQGRQVSLRQEAPSREPTALQQQCRERLHDQKPGTFSKIMGWIALPFVAVGVVAATAATAVATVALTPLAMLVAKAHDVVSGWRESGDLRIARQEAQAQRAQLGRPIDGGGVLGQAVTVKSSSGPKDTSVGDLMEVYRSRLGSSVGKQEMQGYINMGERIVTALKDPANHREGGVMVDGLLVKSNLDTTRAVSWYLQAKGVADNAAPDREPAFLNRGAMVMDDPGNLLYNFLNSAPNAYGRASTHFNERSSSDSAGFGNTGAAGLMAGLKSPQSAQRGIEDFDNRMPSGKGCLVFDKLDTLQGGDKPRLFLKWESVGMPTVFGGGTHADAESGWSGKVWNRAGAVFRCLGHSVNFVHSLSEGRSGGIGIKVDKGDAAPVFQSFQSSVRQAEHDLGKSPGWADGVIKEAREHGLSFMNDKLKEISTEYGRAQTEGAFISRDERGEWAMKRMALNDTQKQVSAFSEKMGVDLGLDRPDWSTRREAVDKGQPKKLYQSFEAVLEQAGHDLGRDGDWAKAMVKDAKKFGVAYMLDTLSNLKQHYEYWSTQPELLSAERPAWNKHLADVNQLLAQVQHFDYDMGHGNERRGAEVHVSL